MSMIETKMTTEYVISCPRCGEQHIFSAEYIDGMLDCKCGFEGYAFAVGDFRIIMTKAEAQNESVVRSMRRFVVSTGRCTDIPPELYMDEHELRELHECTSNVSGVYVRDYDLEEELNRVLEEYQVEAFGEYLLTKELLDSICECLSEEKDIELRRKKDGIEISELKKRKVKVPAPRTYKEASNSHSTHGGIMVFKRGPIDMLKHPQALPGGILNMDSVKPAEKVMKS